MRDEEDRESKRERQSKRDKESKKKDEAEGERKRATRKLIHTKRRVFKTTLNNRLGSGLWALYSAFHDNADCAN